MRARGAGQAAAGRAPSGSADGGRRADEGKGVLGERRDEREGAEADRKLGPRSGEGWGRGEVRVRKVARLAGGAGFRVYIRAPSTCGKVSWHQAMAAVVMVDDPWILRAPLLELNVLWTSEPQDWRPPHRYRQAVPPRTQPVFSTQVVTGRLPTKQLVWGLLRRTPPRTP